MSELRQRHATRLSEFDPMSLTYTRQLFRPRRPLSRWERFAVRCHVRVWRRLRPKTSCETKRQVDHITDLGKLAGCRSAKEIVAFHFGSADDETWIAFRPMFEPRWY